MNKKEMAKWQIAEIIKKNGQWPCKDCSNENWTLYHKQEDLNCIKTGKPRKDVEIKNE